MRRIGVVTIGIMTACFAASAFAGTHPHDRNGFMIGFGLGAGTATLEDAPDREWGGTGSFRIGYALRPDLVLHYEGSAWTRTWDDPLGEVTWTFSTSTAAVSFFPGNMGVLLRGGIGIGVSRAKLDTGMVEISDDESGFGFLVATGYEWRLTRKFALGPHIEYSYQSLDTLGSSNVVSGNLDFNWYW